MRKNVIVVFGGMSSENEISVITGTMVSNLVDEEKYGVYPVYLNTDGEMFADKRLRDVSFYSDPSFRKKAGRALIADGKLYRRKGSRLTAVTAAAARTAPSPQLPTSTNSPTPRQIFSPLLSLWIRLRRNSPPARWASNAPIPLRSASAITTSAAKWRSSAWKIFRRKAGDQLRRLPQRGRRDRFRMRGARAQTGDFDLSG